MATAATTIGNYEIDRELGRGAFGAVYRAHRRDQPDLSVAVKIIEARGNPERLLAEPALLAQVKHPCVVRVEDYFIADGRLVIVLEFVNGDDLKSCIDRGDEFAPEQVRTLLIQLAGALAAAHAQQIVHRDIKPANILVDRTGGAPRFVLTDFGIGRRQEGIQAEKHAGGTYHYMAPEQLRGRPGPQSDLWALGVVAYRLLAGRLPFPGPTLAELARQIQYESPPPPSEVRGSPLPADLETAVMKLLDKSLTERTDSAEQLLKDVGYRGESTKVTDAPARPTAAKRQEPLARRLSRRATSYRWLIVACTIAYILPTGVIAGGLLLTGIALLFAGQSTPPARGRWRTIGLTMAALLILTLARTWPWTVARDVSLFSVLGGNSTTSVKASAAPGQAIAPAPPPPLRGQPPASVRPPSPPPTPGERLWLLALALGFLGLILFWFFLPVIGSALYATWRRVRREQTLWGVALGDRADSDRFLTTMRDMVDTRIEDVSFHLRYAELLFVRGDCRAASVEARLLLVQDPYHFNGNLLLANASAALGLWDDCLRVCDEYLQVAGYCFEFGELRQQCLERLGRS
jgi:serine/threonine-protein kinase